MSKDPFARWRDRYVQPFADGLDARLGVNCFAAARVLAILSMGGYAANGAYHAMGDKDAFALGADLVALVLGGYNASRFGIVDATPASGSGPVVDPSARAFTTGFVMIFAVACFGSFNSILVSVLGRMAPAPAAWNLLAAVAQVVLAFSYILRSCVWSRLPPPRREPAVAAPGGEG